MPFSAAPLEHRTWGKEGSFHLHPVRVGLRWNAIVFKAADRHFLNSDGLIRNQAFDFRGSGPTGSPRARLKSQHPLPGLLWERFCSLTGVPSSIVYFWDWGRKKPMRSPHPTHTHPHDSTRATEMAESTWRNRSVPNGPAAPSPLRPSLGPTMRPCAAPAARPGDLAQGWGGSVLRYLKQSRGNKAGLCAPGQRRAKSRRAARRAAWRMRAAGRACSGYRGFQPRSTGPSLTPSQPAPPGRPKREADFHLLIITCLIEKRNSHFPCFYRKHIIKIKCYSNWESKF